VPGVPTPCDFNVFMGSHRNLKALISGRDVNPPKPPANPPKPDKPSVRRQQEMLKQIGWPIKVDGQRGPQTKGALMDFQLGMAQCKVRLTRDGVCGPKTASWLRWSVAHGGRASEHFTFREFASSRSGWIKVDRDLILGLEKLRAKLGRPIGVLSGYRDFALGASKSQHRYGNAMDPTGPLGSVELVRSVRAFSGIGFDPRGKHVRHVDVRHRGPNFTQGTLTNPTVFADGF
jgi:hypothetical protein